MARKKARSAAQKRNDAKLRARAKAGNLFKKRKSTTKRRKTTKTRKTIKQRTRRKTVARRKTPSKKKGFLSNIPVINNPTFRKAAAGVGTATLGATVLALIAPSIAANPIVRPVLALAGGGVPGVIAQVLTQGGLGGLGLGRQAGSNGMGSNPGFA